MVVGPGEASIAFHTLETLRASHPDSPIFVRDDATSDGTGEDLRLWASALPHALVDRAIAPLGYSRIAQSVFETVGIVDRTLDGEEYILVKLDLGALVVGTLLTERARALFRQRGPGLLGAVERGPAGPATVLVSAGTCELTCSPWAAEEITRDLNISWPNWKPRQARWPTPGRPCGQELVEQQRWRRPPESLSRLWRSLR